MKELLAFFQTIFWVGLIWAALLIVWSDRYESIQAPSEESSTCRTPLDEESDQTTEDLR